jgi:hypothetical protein
VGSAQLYRWLRRNKLSMTIEYRADYLNRKPAWWCCIRDLTGRFISSSWTARTAAIAIRKNVEHWKRSRIERGEWKIPKARRA